MKFIEIHKGTVQLSGRVKSIQLWDTYLQKSVSSQPDGVAGSDMVKSMDRDVRDQ